MGRLNHRAKRRRFEDEAAEITLRTLRSADDPGLRDYFDDLPRLPMRVICSPMGKAINHGGILRLADAFRIDLVTFSSEPDLATEFSGSRGTRRWQPCEWVDVPEAVNQAKSDGYRVYGMALDHEPKPIHEVDWSFPSALVLGEEKTGLSEEVTGMIDEFVAIPMYGMIESLNVTHACALALYEMSRSCTQQYPELQPARSVSRKLLGLPEVDYEELSRGTTPNDQGVG